MDEKQRSINFRDGVQVIYQNWVQKLTRGKIPSKIKWKKRWMVVCSNGRLYLYKECPISYPHKAEYITFEIGPESIIRWDKKTKTISFTVGEEPVARVGVFRVVSPSSGSLKGKENENNTKKWYNTFKEIALRKRMWYVLQMRFHGQEALKPSFPTLVSPPPLYEQKRVSKALEDILDEKFDKDSQELWQKGLRWRGHNIYYEFNNSDIEILWYMYAKHKLYISSDCFELLLGDAFAMAYGTKGTHIQQNSQNFTETINERAYSAMVFLDSKKKDGFVDYEDFKLINTGAFWKNVDFLTPISPDHETCQLWLAAFQCLEDTGTLSKNVIHRLWMRYNVNDDGYLHQQDLEEFLEDFMDVTVAEYPNIDEYLVENFHKMISTRAAIAIRFLNGDESGRVTMQQFAAIGQEDFWVCVDFFPKEEDEEEDGVESETGQTAQTGLNDSPDNEPEDNFIDVIQEPKEKTRIPEETKEKVEISIDGSHKSFAMLAVPEQILENSMGEELTDYNTDSTSDYLSQESEKAEILKEREDSLSSSY